MSPKLVTHHKLCCVCGEHYVRQNPPGVDPSPHCGSGPCKYSWDRQRREEKDLLASVGNACIGFIESVLLSAPPPVVTGSRYGARMYTLRGSARRFFGGTELRPGMSIDRYQFCTTRVGPGAEYEAQHRSIGGRKRAY